MPGDDPWRNSEVPDWLRATPDQSLRPEKPTVSEGSFWPKNWREALPLLVWGVLIFACGFEGIASLLHAEWLQAVLGLGGMFGLTAMLIHWSRLRDNFADVRWLMAAIMVALIVAALSPYVEQRRWPFVWQFVHLPAPAQPGFTQQQVDEKVTAAQAEAIKPIQAQLDDKTKEVRSLNSQLSDTKGALEAASQRIAELQRQKSVSAPPPDGGPITWQNRFILGMGSPSGVQYLIVAGRVVGFGVVQLKDAYIVSDLTGEKRTFLISTRAHNLDAERLPLDQINALPSGAEIWLIIEWMPALSVVEFLNQWGKFHLTINYGDHAYNRFVDEDEIKSDLLSDIGGADLVLGVPRVTKKSPQ